MSKKFSVIYLAVLAFFTLIVSGVMPKEMLANLKQFGAEVVNGLKQFGIEMANFFDMSNPISKTFLVGISFGMFMVLVMFVYDKSSDYRLKRSQSLDATLLGIPSQRSDNGEDVK